MLLADVLQKFHKEEGFMQCDYSRIEAWRTWLQFPKQVSCPSWIQLLLFLHNGLNEIRIQPNRFRKKKNFCRKRDWMCYGRQNLPSPVYRFEPICRPRFLPCWRISLAKSLGEKSKPKFCHVFGHLKEAPMGPLQFWWANFPLATSAERQT